MAWLGPEGFDSLGNYWFMTSEDTNVLWVAWNEPKSTTRSKHYWGVLVGAMCIVGKSTQIGMLRSRTRHPEKTLSSEIRRTRDCDIRVVEDSALEEIYGARQDGLARVVYKTQNFSPSGEENISPHGVDGCTVRNLLTSNPCGS